MHEIKEESNVENDDVGGVKTNVYSMNVVQSLRYGRANWEEKPKTIVVLTWSWRSSQ